MILKDNNDLGDDIMIYRDDSKIIVDGIKRDINVIDLQTLAYQYLPKTFSSKEKEKFVDEVIFRIADLEFENINTYGKSIEEYYFAACRYADKKRSKNSMRILLVATVQSHICQFHKPLVKMTFSRERFLSVFDVLLPLYYIFPPLSRFF